MLGVLRLNLWLAYCDEKDRPHTMGCCDELCHEIVVSTNFPLTYTGRRDFLLPLRGGNVIQSGSKRPFGCRKC